MRRGLEWASRRRLAVGRGPFGWIAGILLTLLTIISLIAVFLGWRLAQGPISLGFAIPQIEEVLSPADGSYAVKVGGFSLRREGLAFLLEAKDLAVYRVDPNGDRELIALATLPTAQIRLSVPAFVEHGVLAPNRIITDGLRVTAERGPEGIVVSLAGDTETDIDGMRLSVLRRVLHDDPRLRYLRTVEMTDLTFRLIDPALGIAWETERTDMRFINGETGFVWHGQVGLATHRGDLTYTVEDESLIGWSMTLPPEPDEPVVGAARALLTVTLEHVEPSLIIELVPGLREIVQWDGVVSGALVTEFATDSLPDTIEYDLRVGAGRLALPGTERHLGFRSAETAGRQRLAGRALEVDKLTLSHAAGTAHLHGAGALRGEDEAEVRLSGSGLNLAWLSTIVPDAEMLAEAEIAVSMDIDALLRRNVGIDRATISIRTDPGRVAIPGVLVEPVGTGEGALDLRIANAGRNIELRRLDVLLPRAAGKPDLPVSVTGSAIKGGVGGLQVVAGELDVSDLKRLWPIGVGEGARTWIVDQVQAGFVPEVTADITFRLPDGPGLGEPEDVRVEARMPLREVALTYWPPMPDATGIDADARITEKLFEATVLRGTTAGMQVTGGNLRFSDIDKGKGHEHTTLSFDITGPVSNLMTALDREPLGFAEFLDLPPGDLGGTISGTLEASFPPIADLTLDQIEIEAAGVTRDLVVPDAAFDQDLSDGRIRFKVDKTALNVDGNAVLAGVALALQGDLNFSDGADFRSRFSLQGTLDDSARQQLGFGQFPFSPEVVSGPVKIDMTATEPASGSAIIDVAADLSDAKVALEMLDWQSPPGDYAAVNSQVRVMDGRLRSVDTFRVTASQLSIAGISNGRMPPEPRRRCASASCVMVPARVSPHWECRRRTAAIKFPSQAHGWMRGRC